MKKTPIWPPRADHSKTRRQFAYYVLRFNVAGGEYWAIVLREYLVRAVGETAIKNAQSRRMKRGEHTLIGEGHMIKRVR